ncbi:autotransporter domain-containing protein [Mesorhizobium sp. CAU 1732]|uniref:autotransporter family protein n=1 Tax=Mesorhizobium sp. CAU 1732 TaxID=3140358 RepID=UPI0032608869
MHRSVTRRGLLASASFLFISSYSSTAEAACSFAPTPGNDVFLCDSDTFIGNLNDPGGSNTLLFPAAGTGTIDGGVTFGNGADRIEMDSGRITGDVNQGSGNDSFIISGGTVDGNIQQGSGLDDFQMTGGVIGSLNQGDELDTFFMSGGRIIDFFDDGDYGVMTGGRIGRVNLKSANNYFEMTGGTIDRNLIAGLQNDTIIIDGGTVGGRISVSNGTDSITIRGGSVGNGIVTGNGNDTFLWENGGVVYGDIDMEADTDTAVLRNLTNAHLGGATVISGGSGTDTMTLDNVTWDGLSRLTNWESIAATNDTELTFDTDLVLGDAGTGTGVLSVDATSTLFGGGNNGVVRAFSAAGLAQVTNAGRIDLTNGGDSLSDTFTIAGNYIGDGGLLLLQTELGDDSSASDRLVIQGGDASGATSISVVNVGGAGASTNLSGIMVVEATAGATTQAGAFSLNGPVAAGAYEYLLFRGGVSAGEEENWYLRSTLINPPTVEPPQPAPAPPPLEPVAPPPPPVAPEPIVEAPPPPPPPPVLPPEPTPVDPDPVDPAPPVEAVDPPPPAVEAPEEAAPPVAPPPPPVPPTEAAPVPAPPGLPPVAPPTPGATPVIADIVPLFRVEVPTYAVVPPVAHHMAISTLGTFHERRGEQALVNGAGWLPTSWARVFGQDADLKWSGTVAPGFDGSLYGFQAGQDIAGWQNAYGSTRVGAFLVHTELDGTVRGQALGWNDLTVGDLDLSATSFGANITHIGENGWYLDAIAMGTWFDGSSTSSRGIGIDLDGSALTLSLEGGYPFALTPDWTLEPQAQLIWNRTWLDETSDTFSTVSFDGSDTLTGRLGARLQGTFDTSAGQFQPYLKANLWHTFDSEQAILFGSDAIVTQMEGTSLELGGGIVAKLSEAVSLHVTGDYTTNLGGEKQRVFEGNVGLTLKW